MCVGAGVSLEPHQVASGVSEATLDRWLSLLEADGWRDDAYGAGAIVLPGRARLAGLPKLPGVEDMFRGWVVAYRLKPGARFTSGSVRLEQDVTGARALLSTTHQLLAQKWWELILLLPALWPIILSIFRCHSMCS